MWLFKTILGKNSLKFLTFFRFLYVNKIKYPNFDIKFVIYAKICVQYDNKVRSIFKFYELFKKKWYFQIKTRIQKNWEKIKTLLL